MAWVFLEDVSVVRTTEKAVLIEYDGIEYWMPKSQLEDPDRLEEGDTDITLGCTEFILREKEIET